MKYSIRFLFFAVCVFFAVSCSTKEDKKFRSVPSGESGITFRNTLKETVDFNIFNYMYFYNGGGVAVGDLNGDDLLDIYFTSNQESNKLYLNQGNFKFKDITELAGVEGFKGWSTGVTIADVNSDGKLDIYVGFLGDYSIYKGKNQLFINEGNDETGMPKFTDRAMEFGLDLVGFSTQATFFDYDKDGDLDMFMLNHSLHENGTFGKSTMRNTPHALAGDKLMRNDNGHFIDVTKGSGIYSSVLGYGLGVVASDVNLDGWPDIYVGNDFHENDYLYMNQGDGTFKEVLEQQMNHTSRYTMGVDFADFNNDAFPDLISMDMLPNDQSTLKSSMAEDQFDTYTFKLNYGYNHQFARNTLQLNNQDGTFSEIGLMSGVSATDWSWSALFADFDLDGFKDIFVSNGILRRSNDLDYVNFITVDSIQMRMKFEMSEKQLAYIDKMPKIKVPNYLFHNNQDSTFTNVASSWGLDVPSYSNGTAYADFDNDGDLDVVINNVEDEALLYENNTISKNQKESKEAPNHFLKITLKGNQGNGYGIGTKVLLYEGGKVQMQECMPTRGYQSSVDYRLIFGAGSTQEIDSLVVIWNDGTFQKLSDVKTNQNLQLEQSKASGKFDYARFHKINGWFKDATTDLNISYKHSENNFVEFNREALVPHMMSAEGPASAVADMNGDGLEDIFLGGGKWQPAHTFFQTKEGKFKEWLQPQLFLDSTYEDVDAIFFDADNDKDEDLFVVSGGNEFSGISEYRQSRLYLNDGHGNLSRSKGLPDVFNTGSCVAANDIDKDGDVDLFLGTRTIPWKYGVKPDSYILTNDGKGNFKDVTDQIAPGLKKFGFVKHAAWADMDGDKIDDLLIAADWSPITIFLNKNGRISPLPINDSGLEQSYGWWNMLYPIDWDSDGDMDLIAGNLGLNSKLHASISEPVKMYVGDFDKNDSIDQIVTQYFDKKEYPFPTRDEMVKQMPSLKKKFLFYHKFAEATIQDMFSKEILDKAESYKAYTFATSYVENLGNGKFKITPLENAAQISPTRSIVSGDFDGDKKTDLILAGNFYRPNIQMGRYDASYGLVLKGNDKGKFETIPSFQSGLSLRGEIRNIQSVKVKDKIYYLGIRNNNTIEVLTLK